MAKLVLATQRKDIASTGKLMKQADLPLEAIAEEACLGDVGMVWLDAWREGPEWSDRHSMVHLAQA